MNGDKRNSSRTAVNLPSLLRGLYVRVADELDLDPSYVSRVARGQRSSEAVEAALAKELQRVLTLANDGAGNHPNHGADQSPKQRGKKNGRGK